MPPAGGLILVARMPMAMTLSDNCDGALTVMRMIREIS